MTTCAYCNRPAANPDLHHPDKVRHPSYTVPMHAKCHTRHHAGRGDFRAWGGQNATHGRPGYELAIAACPGFHHLGGIARAAGARRDARGRFA